MQNDELDVTAGQLRTWLNTNTEIVVLDIRPKEQREESLIPGSVYIDAYQGLNANDPSVFDNLDIPVNVPVVAVCAAGRTSVLAARLLRKKGIEAYSLKGGMKAWSLA